MTAAEQSSAAKRRPDGAALAIAVVLLAIAGLIFFDTSRLSAVATHARIGPATVPYLVAGGLAVLAVWTVFEAWRGNFPEREALEINPILCIVAGLAAQMLLLTTLGFSVATGALFAATAFGFGKRKLWVSLPIGIALSFAIWILFGRLLQLSLPAGPLERLFF